MEYFVVSEETIEDVAEKVGEFRIYSGKRLIDFLRHRMVQAHAMNCKFVIFKAREQWDALFVNNDYRVELFMRHLEERLND